MTDDLLAQARALIKAGEKAQAQRILEPFIEANPHHVPAWMLEAETWPRLQGRRRVLELCLQHNPEAAEPRRALKALEARAQRAGWIWVLVLTLLLVGSVTVAVLWRLASTSYFRPLALHWKAEPAVLVLSATYLVSPSAGVEPLAQVWGDGRMVWVLPDGQTALESQLTREQMTTLLWRVINEGLMKTASAPSGSGAPWPQPAKTANAYELSVSLSDWRRAGRVTADQPRNNSFARVYAFVLSGAGLEGAPFAGAARYLTTARLPVCATSELRPDPFPDVSLDQAREGRWVSGLALAALEAATRDSQSYVAQGSGCYKVGLFPPLRWVYPPRLP